MLKNKNDNKNIVDTIGEALADNILLCCLPEEVNKFKKEFNFKDNENFELEYFYLIMFLQTLACQIVFIENKKFTNEILNSFHQYIDKYIFEKKVKSLKILEAQEIEKNREKRYTQYYKLLRTKRHNTDLGFLMEQLPYDFFSNVFKKDLIYIFTNREFIKRYGMSIILFGFFIREVFKEFIDRLNRIKETIKGRTKEK